MTDTLKIERCPETGICSIIQDTGVKTDLMPDEVQTIADAGGDAGTVRDVLADNDAAFAASLSSDQIDEIGRRLS